MNLYLVQHAEAVSRDEDSRQPLTEKGLVDIEKTAKCISDKTRVSINVIVHSEKLRAKQTADVFADYFKPVGGLKTSDDLAPDADPAIWCEHLNSLSENVMLVGHLPHLQKLASKLLCGDETIPILQFRKGGIACLSRDDPGKWSLQWMVIPELVE